MAVIAGTIVPLAGCGVQSPSPSFGDVEGPSTFAYFSICIVLRMLSAPTTDSPNLYSRGTWNATPLPLPLFVQ